MQAVPQTNAEPFAEVSSLLTQAVNDGVFPGAVLLIGRNGQIIHRQAAGLRSTETLKSVEPLPMHHEMVFDVAGLTQVVVTTMLLMKLLEAEQFKLDDRISRYIQTFGVFGKSPITVAQLLAHCSGLSTWQPFYEDLLRENAGARMGILTSKGAREFIYHEINRFELEYKPGTQQVYSDIGFILLGHLIEILTGTSLERFAQRMVFHPLGLRSTSFIDLSLVKRRGIAPVTEVIVPTEDCVWRKRVLWGEVQDDNAWAMGGIAGHAGLFTSAADLHRFACELLDVYNGKSNFIHRQLLKLFWTPSREGNATGWCLGWDSPSEENELIDCGFSKRTVGMSGFTGCSLWIDAEKNIDIILLSNRVHPNRSNKKIRSFRPLIHKTIMKAVSQA